MIRIYSHSNNLIVFNLKNILENNGIKCFLKNDGLSSTAGETPPTEVWAELWIEREIDQERAELLIKESIDGNEKATSWFCYQCNETNEPAFEICWNCGAERPSHL